MNKIIKVVGAAIIQDGKLFVAKRSTGRSLGDLWEFAGGKIEKNETGPEALKREIFEEFGAECEVAEEFKSVYEHSYDFGTVVLEVFYAKLTSPITKMIEHDETRWVDEIEVQELAWVPTDIPAMQDLVKKGFTADE